MNRILGAVIAGGRSTRFGSDKALAMLGGRPLIDHVIERLAGQTDKVVVVGRTHGGLRSVPDRPAPGLGPLGGLAGALDYAATHGYDAVLTVPCDVPDLPSNLCDAFRGNDGASYVENLPVIGLWPVDALATLDALLAGSGSRSIRAFADRIGAHPIRLTQSLSNLNTPTDLADLRAHGD